ncbi:MAG: hypothetical protein AAGI01_10085 [Myxococcota bacterium]
MRHDLAIKASAFLAAAACSAMSVCASAYTCIDDAPTDGLYRIGAPAQCAPAEAYHVAVIGGCFAAGRITDAPRDSVTSMIHPGGEAFVVEMRSGLKEYAGGWRITYARTDYDELTAVPECADGQLGAPITVPIEERLRANTVAARARLMDHPNPTVARAALERVLFDQDAVDACAPLSEVILRGVVASGGETLERSRYVLRHARAKCLGKASLQAAMTDHLNAHAQRALTRTMPYIGAREGAILRIVSRGYDALHLALTLEDEPSFQLVLALQAIAQEPQEPGYHPAREILAAWGMAISDAPVAAASPRGDGALDVYQRARLVPLWAWRNVTPSLAFYASFPSRETSRGVRRLPTRYGAFAGARLHPNPGRLSLYATPGMSFEVGNGEADLIPTLRLGATYLGDDHQEYIRRMLPMVDVYGVAGVSLSTGGEFSELRTGVGLSSPLGVIVPLLTLGYAQIAVPNAVEFIIETNLGTRQQTYSLNFSIGF